MSVENAFAVFDQQDSGCLSCDCFRYDRDGRRMQPIDLDEYRRAHSCLPGDPRRSSSRPA